MMKPIFLFILISLALRGTAQDQKSGSHQFWENLSSHCGKAYAGEITAGGVAGDDFTGKKLIMHVRACNENTIRIPFFVGEDKSRTWVLRLGEDKLIQLKHDHRKEDGSPDEVTQYGGMNPNTGLSGIQFFPADQETADLIPYASNNVWWITLDDTSFTYNLRRIGSDRLFSVKFDLSNEVETPDAPWGSID